MRNVLYVANIGDSATEETLAELFGQYGEIESVEFGIYPKSGDSFALVKMSREKSATKAINELNGHKIDDRRLTISYSSYDPNRIVMTSKHRKVADSIVEALGETEDKPIRKIHTMVLLCSSAFAQAILEETEEIEEAGGLARTDGERRTKGGVFFYLARYRLPHDIYSIIYNRKGKLPEPKEEEEEEATETTETTETTADAAAEETI